MSNFSLLYDGLITLIEGQLSTYKRLSDAYDVENNDMLRIAKGYSLAIASGENTNRTLCGQLSEERNFIFKLTNLAAVNELDPVAKATIEKSIMEDIRKVYRKLQTTHSLGTVQVSSIRFNTDEGIEYLFREDAAQANKAIGVSSLITLEYFE